MERFCPPLAVGVRDFFASEPPRGLSVRQVRLLRISDWALNPVRHSRRLDAKGSSGAVWAVDRTGGYA